MISLTHLPSAGCLADFSTLNPPPAFDALAFQNCKEQTRTRLLQNQSHQCAFCETPLEDHGDVTQLDHLEPQGDNGGNPARRFDFTNLVACCQTTDTCGHARGQKEIPPGIHPYDATDLHRAFHCSSDGILSNETLPQTAFDFALNTLNLNAPGLKTQRATIITKLQQYTIAAGSNARRRITQLSTDKTGFISLHFQTLGRFGFPEP